MNGYTPSIPVREQIKNLYVQVTDDQFLAALAHADNGNPYDFVRFLVGEALHPVEAAYELEKAMDADGRNAVENEQIKAMFGDTPVTTGAEWRKRHLHQTEEEREEARQNAEMLRALR